MAEATPNNESSKKIGASNRPQNFNSIREQLMGPESGDEIIQALENTPPMKRGQRNQPSIIKYPGNIGRAEVPHVMQFKIFWRWERPDLSNKVDEMKKESKEKVEALQELLSAFEGGDAYGGDIYERNTKIAKLMNESTYLKELLQHKGLKEIKSVAEETVASEQAKLQTISSNRAELLGKTSPDQDERLALGARLNQDIANLNPLEAGAKAGLVAGVTDFATTFFTSSGSARDRLRTATKSGLKTGAKAGVAAAAVTAIAKYGQAAPVYDQMVSIYLPMCNKINQQDAFSYEDAKGTAVLGGLTDVLGGPLTESATQGANALATKAAETKGLDGGVGIITGRVINPRLEKLFKQKGQRSFSFSWEFYPRNEQELKSVKDIIETFRYHSHPALSISASADAKETPEQKQQDHTKMMLRVPAEYEVRFLSSSTSPDTVGYEENPYIPKIGRCVVTDIQVDYTPHGSFTTYNNNAPTSMTFTMSVTEVSQMTREHVEAGY